MAHLQADGIRGTLKAAFRKAAKVTGLDKAASKLRTAFYKAAATKPAGYAAYIAGAVVGDVASGIEAKKTSDLLAGRKGPFQ